MIVAHRGSVSATGWRLRRFRTPPLRPVSVLIRALILGGLLLFLLIGAGCASRPGALPGDGGVGPAREAQRQLLDQGRAFLANGQYRDAVRTLHRLVASRPLTPLHDEGRWSLAQAYEKTEEWEAALQLYRQFLPSREGSSGGPSARAAVAVQRIQELETRLRGDQKNLQTILGILIPAQAVPSSDQLDRWLEGLRKAGVGLLILEAGIARGAGEGSGTGSPDVGVVFRTELAPTLRPSFEDLVPLAHRHGLMVWGSASPRSMTWVDPRMGWSDLQWDPAGRQLLLSPQMDIFHPGFQEYLSGLLRDLVKTGVDGLLFRAEPLGPYDGFSRFARAGFEEDFTIPLDPTRLFRREGAGRSPSDAGQLTETIEGASAVAPEFWRWVGWKARERVTILSRLARGLSHEAPQLHIALEVHPESITRPVLALVAYSEDVLEARRRGFSIFLIRPLVPDADPGRSPNTLTFTADQPAFTERLQELFGHDDTIWLSRPWPTSNIEHLGERLDPRLDRPADAEGTGLIYMRE